VFQIEIEIQIEIDHAEITIMSTIMIMTLWEGGVSSRRLLRVMNDGGGMRERY